MEARQAVRGEARTGLGDEATSGTGMQCRQRYALLGMITPGLASQARLDLAGRADAMQARSELARRCGAGQGIAWDRRRD